MTTTGRRCGDALGSHASLLILNRGLTEAELGLDELRRIAEHTLGAVAQPWYFSYRVRIGVK